MTNDSDQYQIAPYVAIGYSGEVLKFGFGSIQIKVHQERWKKAVVDVAEYLLSWHTLKEIEEKCSSLFEYPESINLYKFFTENNFLIKRDDYNKSERYSRHALFYRLSGTDPNKVQYLLQKKKVIIVGCGGIGNLLGVTLATAGIGNIVLVDDDIIEISNLTRQIMFCEQDIGLPKAEVLEKQLAKRASNIKIESYNIKLDSKENFNKLPPADLLIISGDSPKICVITNKYCFEENVPFINVGYIQDIAVWGPLIIPGKTPCYECFMRDNISDKISSNIDHDRKIKNINQNYQAPSIGPINMLSASHASLDIIKYLGGFGKVQSINKRIGIWTNNLEKQTQIYLARRKAWSFRSRI